MDLSRENDMKDNKSNIWKNIGITTTIVLSMFLAYFLFSNSNTYKKEIKSLETTIDSLEQSLENKVDRDSIMKMLDEQELLNILLKKSNKKIDSLKKENTNENITDYYSISIDSNIVILSGYLCE